MFNTRNALAALLLAGLTSGLTAQTAVEEVAVKSYLSVTHLGTQKGMPATPQGAYTCAFDRSNYTMRMAGLVTVKLLNSTDARFEIVSLRVDGDSKAKYAQRSVSPRSASFYGSNKTVQSIYFTVFVRDLLNGQIVECDPEILNVPT
jgi:hypothetical protein